MQSATLYYHDSGPAPGLPTDLKPTLHTALVQVATNTVVVGGEDAEEPDTSKTLNVGQLGVGRWYLMVNM